MNKNSRIYIAGHQGLVGSSLVRLLHQEGYTNLITRSFVELDLRNQEVVNNFFKSEQPEYVFLAAAKVGGIKANSDYPADFLYDNLMIAANVIHAAYQYKVTKLLFLGSSCIYPRSCAQPIKEEYLLTGELEATNEPYALAKIAGLKMCAAYNKQHRTNFICAMPTNLYGPGDTFDSQNSHVIPALIKKFHEAKINGQEFVQVWGSGNALREFLFVDDLSRALLMLMKSYNESIWINVGTGTDISIKQLAELIKKVVGFKGIIQFDATKPDGTTRKLLDAHRIHSLGWKHKIELEEGLVKTYDWFLQQTTLSDLRVYHEVQI